MRKAQGAVHLPVLRAGRPYESVAKRTLAHVVTGEPVASVSQANAGLVARDLARAAEHQRALEEVPAARLLEICREAAALFTGAELPLGDEGGPVQSPGDYVRQLSATTGMPEALCRANMGKIEHVLAEMETVLSGLTRGLDLAALDTGWGYEGGTGSRTGESRRVDGNGRGDAGAAGDSDATEGGTGTGRLVSFRRTTDVLGVVLPSNSPGVHSLWIPSIALKVPVALKPGAREPWTPLRVAQALLAAGCPGEAISFYPADHAAATEILLASGRSMLFGDRSTVGPWKDDPRVELHGPGWSKVLLGEDRMESWEGDRAEREAILDLLAESVAANGGRSCINASGVWVPRRGREVAEALAERLAAVEALPLDHPQARLAAFSEPRVAELVSKQIDSQLAGSDAVDLTREIRGHDRLVEVDGLTFLLPTVVWCEDPGHPLVEAEYLFPFVSVVEVPQERMLRRLGPSLVVSALTEDPAFLRELLASDRIDRLNLTAVPTCRVSWDQPHEGNLFTHLYRQRALAPPPEHLASLFGAGAAKGTG